MSKFSELYGSKTPPPPPAEEVESAADPNLYVGYEFNRNGRPVMGFSLAHVNGNLDGFLYHSINHPKFQVRDGQEFLTFTYSGTAVVLTGRCLRLIFDALMRHTLKSVHEYDGRQPVKEGAPVITRLSVTQAVPVRTADALELVKPSKQAV